MEIDIVKNKALRLCYIFVLVWRCLFRDPIILMVTDETRF